MGEGSDKQKAVANIAAIRLMKTILAEKRGATAEEQAILVKYTGWGALTEPMWRDEKNGGPNWPELTTELESLVTAKELEAMKGSGLNAHYTSPQIIDAMYSALARLGIKPNARALEPSAGIGHFLGLAPPDLKIRWSGVELDSVTGGILKLLYPNADVKVAGFESVKNRNGAYDIVIGNVPFGSYGVHDPAYNKHNLLIHDYFIVKALDLVRPGGIVALITSHGTLDKTTQKGRQLMADRGELIGAIRLPTGAFQKNAGTAVVTDMLFFRVRKPGETITPESREWVSTQTVELNSGESATIGTYFAKNPEMVLGQTYMGQGNKGQPEYKVRAPRDLDAAVAGAIAKLPENVYVPPEGITTTTIQDDEKLVEGSFTVKDGKLLQAVDGKLTDAGVPTTPKVRQRLMGLVKLKELYRKLMTMESADADPTAIEKVRAELNKAYDAFRKAYGPLSAVKTTSSVNKNGVESIRRVYPAITGFQDDPDWNLVFNLDVFDEETGIVEKSKILKERQLMGAHVADRADNADMALVAVLAESGSIDFEKIAQMTGQTEAEVTESLMGRLIFKNPVSGMLETDDVYLSGNTRKKLKEAQKAAKKDKDFEANVRALEGRQPKDVPPSEITANPGASWIPVEEIAEFAAILFGLKGTKIKYAPMSSRWKVEPDYRVENTPDYTNKYSVVGDGKRYLSRSARNGGNAGSLLEAVLNGTWVTITEPDENGDPVANTELTQEARDKQKAIIEAFQAWSKEPTVAARLAKIFNEKININVMPKVDGSGLVLHGVATNMPNGKPFSLMKHQKNAIWRAIRWGNTLLAHPVGAGKTFEMVGIIMEHKRLGLAQKPLWTVPNHMLEQAAREFRIMYPNAKLLVATERDFDMANRRSFIAKAAAHDWDAIIMTHKSFELVPVGVEIQQEYLEQEMAILAQQYKESEKEDGARAPSTKDIQAAMRRLQKKLDKLMNTERKDDFISFENMRVDMLVVDEFHNFKNLDFPTRNRSLQKEGSGRATDMHMKSMYTNKVNPGRGLFGATGTPLTNSIAEQYVLMRFFQPDVLKEMGVESFDAWAASFGSSTSEIEVTVTGGFKSKERFREFNNVFELGTTGRQFMDVVRVAKSGEAVTEDVIVLKTPALKGGKPEVVVAPVTEFYQRYKKYLGWRAKNLPKGKPQPGDDNILNISTDARHAAIDMRLVSTKVGDLADNKINQSVRKLHEIYKRTSAVKGVQAVFCDYGVPGSDSSARGGVPGFNVYDDIRDKLVALGIPKNEIVFIQEARNKKHKAQILRDVNDGKVRIIIGSSTGMGEGTNMQARLVALHRIDSVWRPDIVEQTEGRILRMGNILYDTGKIDAIEIFRYVQEGSYDTFMWQKVETKQGFIEQFLMANPDMRMIEELGEERLTPEQVKAASSDDPRHWQKAGLSALVTDLKRRKNAFYNAQVNAAGELKKLPIDIAAKQEQLAKTEADVAAKQDTSGDKFTVTIDGTVITKRPDAGKALVMEAQRLIGKYYAADTTQGKEKSKEKVKIGTFAGFDLYMEVLSPDLAGRRATVHLILKGQRSYLSSQIKEDDVAASTVAILEAIPRSLERHADGAKSELEVLDRRLRGLKDMSEGQKWPQEGELDLKEKELEQLDADLTASGASLDAGLDGSINEDNWDILPDKVRDDDAESGNPVKDFLEDEEGSLNISAVLDFFKRKPKGAPAIESDFAHVEERLLAAEGLHTPNIHERLKRALMTLKESLRHYALIDQSESPMWAEIQNILLNVEHSKHAATARAQDAIDDTVRGLSQGELRNFTRLLILPDILKDIEAGLYDSKDLPFGYKSEDEVQQDLDKLDANVTQAVKDALARRDAFQQKLTADLVSHGLLPESVLEDDRYYHRQVMEHMSAMEMREGQPRDVRTKTRGFQMGRSGGGDFNTRYEEAESEWVIQAHREIAMVKALETIKRLADVTPQLKKEAKAMNRDRVEQKTGTRPKSTVSQADLRAELGDDYVEWQTLIEEGYKKWSPEKNDYFFRGMGVAGQAFDALIAAGAGPAELVNALRSVKMLGKKPEWVIPDNLAVTLDNFKERPDPAAARGLQKAQGWWRQWILLNPFRWSKYFLNNLSGDLDAILLQPKILRHIGRAMVDVKKFYWSKTASPQLRAELLEWTDLRVLSGGMTTTDIPDLIQTIPSLNQFITAHPIAVMKGLGRYWHYARLVQTMRENTLRLAAARYFDAEMKAGRDPGPVVSNPVAAKALKGRQRAALLANDLVGDYGAIAGMTEHARKYYMAFPSWMDINAKRYTRLYANAMRGNGPGIGSAVAISAKKVAAATMMANVFFLFVNMANHMFFPEEEEELRKEGRTLHLILGRNKDGSIRTVRIEGAYADFLEWLRLEDYPSDIRDVVTGKAKIGEKLKEAAGGPVEKIIGGVTPFIKSPIEALLGYTLYPSAWKPRQIRDKGDFIASSVSMSWLYRRITDKPIRPSTPVLSLILYQTDPGEAAFFHIRERASKFLVTKRGDPGAIRASDKSNALYYFKQAARWDQPEQAQRWLKKYYEMGGTKKGAQQSVGTGDPLQFLPKKYHAEFKKSLDSDELRALEAATTYSKHIGRAKALETWRKTPYAKKNQSGRP